MTNNRIIKILILSLILSVGMVKNTIANKSLSESQTELAGIVQKIIQTDNLIQKYETKIADLDLEITRLEFESERSWYERRKIVKKTEEKAALNQEKFKYYEQLLKLQNSATEIASNLFPKINQHLDSLILVLNTEITGKQRDADLEQLLTVIELRNWVIDVKKSYFPPVDAEPVPQKINIQEFLNAANVNINLKKDLIRFLDTKIDQLAAMIAAANEEEKLRSRLEQFTMEMSALNNEFPDQSQQFEFTQTTSPNSKNNENTFAIDGNNIPPDRWNQNYTNWAIANQTTQFNTPLSELDILPLIKDLKTAEIAGYISTLDSIRTFYIQQKQELLKQ
jgi:hypothetical protein